MTYSPNDVLEAVCLYLETQPYVTSLIGSNLFRPDLPREMDEVMPQAAVIARAAGGYTLFGKSWMPVGDPRIDLVCFGSTVQEANDVARACVVAMKQLQQSVYNGITLYWAMITGGPVQSFEPETLWPEVVVTTQVMYAE